MASGLDHLCQIKRSGLDPWLGTLHCVLEQDTLYSHDASSTQVHKLVPANLMLGGYPCDGLASHPGGVEIFLVALCYRNCDKLQPDGQLGL